MDVVPNENLEQERDSAGPTLAHLSLDEAYARRLIAHYRATTAVFDPLHATIFGGYNDDEMGEIAEIASVLASVEGAGDRYRLVVLGAAPGEWAIKGERAYRYGHPGGDYRSINLEGDIEHYEMTKACIAANSVSIEHNEVRYQVIADRDGFAYFPVINAERDWGAGLAAVSESADDLDDKISMNAIAIGDRIAANDGKPLEFRTVPAVSLTTLLEEVGTTDLLHCDIQGAEREVFPAGMAAMNRRVKLCCISTHGPEIERILTETFAINGWRSLGAYPCHTIGEGEDQRITKDGIFLWINSALVGEPVQAYVAPVKSTKRLSWLDRLLGKRDR